MMIQEIATAIVMFLLGSVLTYFSTRWSKTLKKIDSLEYGVQSILRDRICQMHRYYTDKKKGIPQQEVDSLEQMYDAYKKLGGNGYIDDLKDRLVKEYPHENH